LLYYEKNNVLTKHHDAQSDYDLADFIVYILALPVLIGCVVASTCLLRRWTDTSRGLLIVYNVAVVVTFMYASPCSPVQMLQFDR
jgi:hypothetical protein